MPRDYAKDHRAAASPRWVFYLAGVLSGLLGGLLIYLWHLGQLDALPAAGQAGADAGQPEEVLKLDFYEIFPKREVPIEADSQYAVEAAASSLQADQVWVLQAGSFRNPEDAEARRAQLILMGLQAEVRRRQVDGQRWHRVLAGPFATDQARKRAQARLAQERIAFLPLKVAK